MLPDFNTKCRHRRRRQCCKLSTSSSVLQNVDIAIVDVGVVAFDIGIVDVAIIVTMR